MRQGLAGTIREIRLSTDKATGKPKGFGFVELADHVALTVCSRYPWAKLATPRFGRHLGILCRGRYAYTTRCWITGA